jgi:hypothetical protein
MSIRRRATASAYINDVRTETESSGLSSGSETLNWGPAKGFTQSNEHRQVLCSSVRSGDRARRTLEALNGAAAISPTPAARVVGPTRGRFEVSDTKPGQYFACWLVVAPSADRRPATADRAEQVRASARARRLLPLPARSGGVGGMACQLTCAASAISNSALVGGLSSGSEF